TFSRTFRVQREFDYGTAGGPAFGLGFLGFEFLGAALFARLAKGAVFASACCVCALKICRQHSRGAFSPAGRSVHRIYSDFGVPSGVKRISAPRPVFCVGNQTAVESVLQEKDPKTHHGKDRSKKTERDRAERQRQKPHSLRF